MTITRNYHGGGGVTLTPRVCTLPKGGGANDPRQPPPPPPPPTPPPPPPPPPGGAPHPNPQTVQPAERWWRR